jgi:hypothetical protein
MINRHFVSGSCTVKQEQRAHLSILHRRPENLDKGYVEPPSIKKLDRQLDETVTWWHAWSSRSTMTGPYAGRSAIVLKSLSDAPHRERSLLHRPPLFPSLSGTNETGITVIPGSEILASPFARWQKSGAMLSIGDLLHQMLIALS